MPRISPKTRAAFDILDCLFFNQTWFLRLSEDDETLYEGSPRAEELVALYKIMDQVTEQVGRTGATGIAAQALKHTVYCILEAGFSDDIVQKGRSGHSGRFDITDDRGISIWKQAKTMDPILAARLHEHEQTFSMAFNAVVGNKAHGVCAETALAIAATVRAMFNDAPSAARYRLTERVFVLEFMDAPVKFLSWMYRIGVISSQKFAAKRATRNITEDFKARVGLLCEFMLMRDFMARLSGKETIRHKSIRCLQEELGDKLSDAAWTQLQEENDFYMRLDRYKASKSGMFTFDLGRLADEAYVHDFLTRFAENHWRSRFWTGPQQSWTGVLGAGMMWAYHSLLDPQRKMTRNGNNYSKPGATVVREKTVAQHVCQNLNEHGLACMPGSLYETFIEQYMKRPAGLYHRASVYHTMQQKLDFVFPMQNHDVAYLGVITTSTP